MMEDLPTWVTPVGIAMLVFGVIIGVLSLSRFRTEQRQLNAFLEGAQLPDAPRVGNYLKPLLDSDRLATFSVVLAVALVTHLVADQLILTGAIAGVVGVALESVRGVRERRHRKIIATQFADSLGGFASAMSAGNSFARGLQQVAQGAPEPIRHEWEQVLAEVELGSQVSAAVAGLAERTHLREAEWLAHVLRLHERTGTPAATLLKQIAAIVRQNESLDLEITALTAEGRMAAYVVAALPVALVIFIQLSQPDYLDPLSSGRGIFVSIGMFVSILGGLFWIRRMVASVEA